MILAMKVSAARTNIAGSGCGATAGRRMKAGELFQTFVGRAALVLSLMRPWHLPIAFPDATRADGAFRDVCCSFPETCSALS
jgi:hypothetical protein